MGRIFDALEKHKKETTLEGAMLSSKTVSETEKNQVIATYPENIWRLEGVAYYAYATSQANSTPMYRFWSDTKQGHFYTTSLSERNYVMATYPENVWKYEGIAYYVPEN